MIIEQLNRRIWGRLGDGHFSATGTKIHPSAFTLAQNDKRWVIHPYPCYNLTSKKGEIMDTLATTRMSSKGQVVIPESIRKQLNLQEGAQFIVVGEGDVVVLKVVNLPDMSQFDELIKQARQQAKEAGLTEEDVTSAVAKARGKK
jgi:AbrB family looped-hinge helix DNA binding protein